MTPKKAAIYCRVSTTYQVDKDSLPVQEESLIAYTKQVLGIDEYELFTDAGYSGKNTERPAYQDMMSRCRNHGRCASNVCIPAQPTPNRRV